MKYVASTSNGTPKKQQIEEEDDGNLEVDEETKEPRILAPRGAVGGGTSSGQNQTKAQKEGGTEVSPLFAKENNGKIIPPAPVDPYTKK